MPRYTDHMGLVITTNSAVAAARYADGVELLLGVIARRDRDAPGRSRCGSGVRRRARRAGLWQHRSDRR